MTDPTHDSLIHALARTPSLTRSQLHKRASVAYGLAIGGMLAVFAAVGGTGHSAMRAPGTTALVTLGVVAFGALASFLISKRASSPLGHSDTRLAAVLCCVPFALLAWLSLLQPSAAHAQIPVGFRCLALTVVLGGMLLAAMTYARRASDPVHPGWLGAAFGATAAVWAAALVVAWCPLYDLRHTALGHVAPALVLSAAGAALARRALRL